MLYAGTSIGAFIGGLYAREGDLISSTARAKQFSGRMGNIWRILSDVTYPIVAYTTVSQNIACWGIDSDIISRDTNSTGLFTKFVFLILLKKTF